MEKIDDAIFTGASGTKYSFEIHHLGAQFINVGAVYVFTKRAKRAGKLRYTFLYIGETGELADRVSTHEKWPCAIQHDVNCICVHREDNESSRREIETDLRQANHTPCNDQ
ncbi:MAG: hypothetical protein ACE5GF_06855 [Thermodesulfobacteriota bacterium]